MSREIPEEKCPSYRRFYKCYNLSDQESELFMDLIEEGVPYNECETIVLKNIRLRCRIKRQKFMKCDHFKDIKRCDFPETIPDGYKFTLEDLYGRKLTQEESGWEYAHVFEPDGWAGRPHEARYREGKLEKAWKKL